MVILRVWRATLDPTRVEGYRRFEAERFLPMLHKQPGFLAAFFLRATADRAASFTIWEDRGAVEALGSSPSYRREARELAESRLLASDPSVEILEVGGGTLRPEALMRALPPTRRPGPPSSSVTGPVG